MCNALLKWKVAAYLAYGYNLYIEKGWVGKPSWHFQ